jgi:hypothetical protein
MNLSKQLRLASRVLHNLFFQFRFRLPRQRCLTFFVQDSQQSGIGPIFVINLDRQKNRWADVLRELDCIWTLPASRFRSASFDTLHVTGRSIFQDPLTALMSIRFTPSATSYSSNRNLMQSQMHSISDARLR